MQKEKKQNPFSLFLKNNFNRDILLYGGVEWTFWAIFATLAFTTAHLAQVGFSSKTTGVIMALVSVAGIVASPVVGNLSDRIGSPRKLFIILGIIASVFYALVPLTLRLNHGQEMSVLNVGVLMILLWAAFSRPMQGLCESWVISAADRKRTFVFGKVRYFGSIGYALICILFGALSKRLGTQVFTFYSFGILFIPAMLLAIYAGRDESKEKVERKKGTSYGVKAAIKNYYLVMFFVCHCLVMLPMVCSTTFVPYKLMEISGDTSSLGNITAIRALMEIPMLLGGTWIVHKFGIKRLFILDMLLFALSMVLFILAKNTIVITLGMMAMGTAYGAHLLGQVNYVYRITPPEATASAQTLAVSFSLVASVLGNLIGGVLVERFTASGMYLFLLVLVVLALAIFLLTFPIGRALKIPEPDLKNVM